MRLRRAVAWLLCIVLLIGVALIGSRVLVLYAARRVLSHWSDAGLPGDAPRGSGPFADMHWPPRVRWLDLRWGEGAQIQLHCSKLEIAITPADLLLGRLNLTQVEVQDLHVSGMKPVSPWTDLILQSLNDSGPVVRPDRGRKGIRFGIGPVVFDSSSVRLSRLEGWAWAPHNAGWAFVTRAAREGLRGSMIVRGSGSGAAGAGDLTLDAEMGENRLLHLNVRRPSGGGWVWQLSGRDDGAIASTLLSQRTSLTAPVHGSVDFTLSRGPSSTFEGEAELRELQVGSRASHSEDELTVNGRLCLSGGILSLQEVDLHRGDSRVRIDADFPFSPGDSSSGRCVIDGKWNGSVLHLDGAIHHIRDGFAVRAPSGDLLGIRTGAVDLRWTRPSQGSVSGLDGSIRIGSGTVAVRGGIGSPAEPLLLQGREIPISAIEPWFPFHVPGDWSGKLDAQATVRLTSDGWCGEGNASLVDGQIRGLPLFDEIGALRGERGIGSVRFDRISTRWSYGVGCFLADSLLARSRSMRIEGSIVYASPDSLFGILRLSPGGGSDIGSILRLLGGNATLDVGICGSVESPAIVLLDPSTRAQWRERIESVRHTTARI